MQAIEQTRHISPAPINETDPVIRTYDKDVSFVVRDNKYTKYKSYIHIKQYQIINDEQAPIMIATPRLEINYSMEHHSTFYWYMEIFPYLEKGKQFHRMIKRLEASNKKYIQEKFGEGIEYKSCLIRKKNVPNCSFMM